MQIVVAGGHGQIAMLLHPLLIKSDHRVRGLIRNPGQADALQQVGAEPVICDLEAEEDVSKAVGSADAVVFAAGAGPGSGAIRKMTMDRDGAIKLIAAAEQNHIRRYVMISAIHAEEPRGDDVFRAYLRAKSEADEALRCSGLDYTTVRPGRLNDERGRGPGPGGGNPAGRRNSTCRCGRRGGAGFRYGFNDWASVRSDLRRSAYY